jgi:hypothetical protein
MAAWSCRAWRSTRRRGNPRCRGPEALLRTPRHRILVSWPGASPLCRNIRESDSRVLQGRGGRALSSSGPALAARSQRRPSARPAPDPVRRDAARLDRRQRDRATRDAGRDQSDRQGGGIGTLEIGRIKSSAGVRCWTDPDGASSPTHSSARWRGQGDSRPWPWFQGACICPMGAVRARPGRLLLLCSLPEEFAASGGRLP